MSWENFLTNSLDNILALNSRKMKLWSLCIIRFWKLLKNRQFWAHLLCLIKTDQNSFRSLTSIYFVPGGFFKSLACTLLISVPRYDYSRLQVWDLFKRPIRMKHPKTITFRSRTLSSSRPDFLISKNSKSVKDSI